MGRALVTALMLLPSLVVSVPTSHHARGVLKEELEPRKLNEVGTGPVVEACTPPKLGPSPCLPSDRGGLSVPGKYLGGCASDTADGKKGASVENRLSDPAGPYPRAPLQCKRAERGFSH